MRERKLTSAQEKCLRAQSITADQPGTVLRDFRMLLDFLEPQGVESGGKYNLLPMKFIDELDSRLSRPLVLEMKRPQLRSHPYLQGLNLLLRASGLSRIEASGSKSRLVLDPAMLTQWNGLNPTEQYFNLLEAWLRIGRAEMVGEQGRGWGGDLFSECLQTWKYLPEGGSPFDPRRPQEVYLHGIGRSFYLLALMDMFGLLDVTQPRPPITTWVPARVNCVPFGDAVFTLLDSQFLADLRSDPPPEEGEDQEGAESMQPRFGAWQPLFQPYFPEWRQNLELPEPEPRTGTSLFRVSLGKVWRLIAMPAESTLDDLVAWILRSVKFDSDHLYRFKFRDRLGATVRVNHPEMDEGPWTSEVSIGTLPLETGQSMELEYDFGDCWKFTVKLERIEPPGAKVKAPAIIEKHGKSPEQYPNWDD
jgi:Plasmid pRiA4b ORF-3-like protein